MEQKNISEFEKSIISKCKSEKPDIISSISKSGKLDEDTEKSLNEIITELKKSFKD